METVCFLGFDGGGTKCSGCAMAETGEILSSFTLHSSTNHNSVGWDGAEKAFARVVEGLQLQKQWRVAGVCMGMAGTSRESEKLRWETYVKKMFSLESGVAVFNDAVTALASGTGGELEGIVLISGTGTISLGRDLSGKQVRCQGWGPLLGDVGSGYDIGMEALKAVMRGYDGLESPTLLKSAVLKYAGLQQEDQLIEWVYSGSKEWERFAALAPLVEECLLKGDEAAKRIVEKEVVGMLQSVATVAQKLELSKPWKLVLSGGTLVRGEGQESPYSKRLKELVLEKWGVGVVDVVYPKISASHAAAIIAAKNKK